MPQVHRRVQKSTKSNAKNCLSFSARLILYWQTRQSWGIVAQPALKHKEPTRLSAAIFSLKAAGLRGKRFVTDRKRPLLRFATGKKADYPTLLAEARSPLFSATHVRERTQTRRRDVACYVSKHRLALKRHSFSRATTKLF